jgi:DNA-binding CsgD family transcriptional regulator
LGRIRTSNATHSWLLTAHHLVGRSRTCQLRVDTPETSSEHASLRWRAGTWELQDLHSRNGTYVGARLLGAGRRARLEEGARLGFGRPDEFVLFDAGPPEPHAIGLAVQQPTIEARVGLLLLPDAERPEVMVCHRDNAWWVQRDDEVRPIADGEVVATSAGAWRLHLPEQVSSTRDAEGDLSLSALRQARLVLEETRRRHATLSPQEERVCRLVAAGLLNKQIAGEMGLAEQTVRLYRGRALKKLGVAGVADLVRFLARVAADE